MPTAFDDLGLFAGGTGTTTRTRVFRSPNLAKGGDGERFSPSFTNIGAITVEDNGSKKDGGNGIYSGFDINAIFLSRTKVDSHWAHGGG